MFHDDPRLIETAKGQTPGQLRQRIEVITRAIRDAREDSAVFWRLNQQAAALERVLHAKESV